MESLNVSRQRHASDAASLARLGLSRPERADTQIVYLYPYNLQFPAPAANVTTMAVHRASTVPFDSYPQAIRSIDFPVTVIGTPINTGTDNDTQFLARRAGDRWYVQGRMPTLTVAITVRWPATPSYTRAGVRRYTGSVPTDLNVTGTLFNYFSYPGYTPGGPYPPAWNQTITINLGTGDIGDTINFYMVQSDAAGVSKSSKSGSTTVAFTTSAITFDIDGSGGYA